MSDAGFERWLTITAAIEGYALRTPGKAFYIATDTGAELDFATLRSQCQALAGQFAALGFRAGDKVSVYMPNGPMAAVALLGTMAAGLVANPINLMSQPSQLSYVLGHSDTRLVFTTPDLHPHLQSVLKQIDREVMVVCVDANACSFPDFSGVQSPSSPGTVGTDKVQRDDPALLMYTSGTTGVPKGVVLSHGNLLTSAVTLAREHHLGPEDRVLGSLPLYHINGLVVTLLAPLVTGGSVAMTPRFSVVSFWPDAISHECTWINVVPTIVAYLLNDVSTRRPSGLERIRFCRTASAALSPDHLNAFEARFGISVIETMGLTETAAPVFTNPWDRSERRLGSIGRPSGAEARIIDGEGHPLSHHEHGEIVLKGANVMQEYYKDPERTRDAFTNDGWLRTGDIGYHDEDGFYYIVGRAKELIIKGGENIAPREIDEVVIRHPSVLDAAAVGIPHPDYGQDIAVYLVLRDGAVFDHEAMRAHCLGELGRYKSPSRYVVVDELPRGPSGKVQRLKLLELQETGF
ncbi:MAG: AMP-binding protein [Castellaniella sp.]